MTPDAALRAAADAFVEALVEYATRAAAQPDAPDRLLSVEQAAAALGIGRSTCYDLVMDARLRSFKVGSRRLVPEGAIRDFIEEASR